MRIPASSLDVLVQAEMGGVVGGKEGRFLLFFVFKLRTISGPRFRSRKEGRAVSFFLFVPNVGGLLFPMPFYVRAFGKPVFLLYRLVCYTRCLGVMCNHDWSCRVMVPWQQGGAGL